MNYICPKTFNRNKKEGEIKKEFMFLFQKKIACFISGQYKLNEEFYVFLQIN